MLKMDGERITEISVSDPNRELGRFYFSVSTEIQKQGENFRIEWMEMENMSEVKIDLPHGNFDGQSVTIKL
jgi:chondroitin AC lyase